MKIEVNDKVEIIGRVVSIDEAGDVTVEVPLITVGKVVLPFGLPRANFEVQQGPQIIVHVESKDGMTPEEVVAELHEIEAAA
jgi:hypothetical protein